MGQTVEGRYRRGAKKLENMIVRPQGSVYRRGGTHFVVATKDFAGASKATRLIPFEFATDVAYVLEMGDLYMRFYQDEAQIQLTGSPYEIVTPYSDVDIDFIQYAQTGDIMYLSHPDYPIHKLTRLASDSWTLEEVDFYNGAFLDTNDTATTMLPSAGTGSITVTSSTPYFTADHVGSLLRIDAGYVKITGFTSDVLVDADVVETVAVVATNDWAEGAWNEINGYPRTVSFFQDRLVMGGTDAEPQKLWGSKVAEYEDFSAGVLDSDAFSYTVSSDKVNVFQWLTTQRDTLYIGTAGSVFKAQGGEGVPITPTNIFVTRITADECALARPLAIGNEVAFITRTHKKIKSLDYSLEQNAIQANDLTFLADQVSGTGIVNLHWALEPDSIIWSLNADGELIGLTYYPSEAVMGWHRHPLNGEVESISVIPKGESYQLWLCVKRTINAVVVRHIEFLDPNIYLESFLTYNGAPAKVFGGLDHLEGETLKVVGDDAEHPDVVVSGGQITLLKEASKVEAGLGYMSKLEPVPPEIDLTSGTIQGFKKRWIRFYLKVLNSHSPTVNGYRAPTKKGGMTMNQAPDLVTGNIRFQGLEITEDGALSVETDKPFPLEVLSIFGTIDIGMSE